MRILLATANSSLGVLIKRSLSRFHYEWVETDNGLDAFQKGISTRFDLMFLDFDLPRMESVELLRRLRSSESFKFPHILVFTHSENQRKQIESERFPKIQVIALPIAIREFVDKVEQLLHHDVRLTCVGGGTGLFTLLSGLKSLSNVHLTSIVSMSDDGGSTGKLRDSFGILPPGDIRRSIVALSTAPDLLNELIQYRFERGKELKGHNLGNLLLAALSEMRGSMSEAVKSLSEILNIQGKVIPVTNTVNTLRAELENGQVLTGEHRIDLFEGRDPKVRIKQFWQEPQVAANPDAIEALFNANFILLGPGDLYTSLISNLIVEGIAEAVTLSRAKKIYISNIMTKPGETTDFKVSDHIQETVKYLKKDCLDYVLCSSTVFSKETLRVYAQKGQAPVIEKVPEDLRKITRAKIFWEDCASESEWARHDSLKLASAVKKIMDDART